MLFYLALFILKTHFFFNSNMNMIKLFSSYKLLSVIITTLILIFIVGVIGRNKIELKIINWAESTTEKVQELEELANQLIYNKQAQLIGKKDNLLEKLKNVKEAGFENLNEIIPVEKNKNIKLAIYQNEELYFWNENFTEQLIIVDSLKYDFGETYFLESDINSYLIIRDTFSVNNSSFQIYLAEIIEKQYQLNENIFESISLSKDIEEKIGTDFTINYSAYELKSKDGRKHSFIILNNKNDKIGIATLLKPSREIALKELENTIYTIQGLLALFGFLAIGFFVKAGLKRNTNKLIQVFTVTIYLVALRYLLVIIKFPQKLFSSDILSDKYFFSNFGSGLAYSPGDLFISLIFLFVIILFYFRSSLKCYISNDKNERKPIIIAIIVFAVGLLIYLIALRSTGASVRGFVFDTSLRYFQSTSLSLTMPHFLMHVNLLLLGLISILGSVTIIVLILRFIKTEAFGNKLNTLFLLLIVFFISEIIYHNLQHNPQLNLPIKFIQFILVFSLTHLITNFNLLNSTKVILFFLSASIFSISSLLFYNTELEKSSLKTTASIISRVDDTWYKDLIYETLLSEFSRNEAVSAFSKNNASYNASAFKVWSNSKLQKESINSSVNFFNLSGELLGGFGSIYPRYTLDKFIDTNFVLEEIQIFEEPLESMSQKLIRGIFPVKDDYAFIGYLDVSILYDLNDFGFSSYPEFISAGKLNERAILKLDKLIILDYREKELKTVYGNLSPTQKINSTILNTNFSKKNDVWLSTELNGGRFIVYVKKTTLNNIERIVAVALREKELSIGLFDFFKIFFSHAIILFLIILIYYLNINKNKFKYSYNLRTQLLIAFLIISLIPLILTAFYFRNLTEDKNKDAIYYKLGKRAFSIENYLNEYSYSIFDRNIYEKASNDLNINYSLYKQNKLEYSSQDLLYNVGLLPKILNPIAYKELFINGSQEALVMENVDEYKFNTFYYKANITGEEIIIKISDGVNRIQLPLTGSEADVFLFGIYSLAVVLIIIFSAIFANQISLPIRKITSATKSVAAGDLSLHLKTTAKGELNELVSGFQYMIKELKKNQTILAEIEREEAWKEMAKQVAHEIKNPLTPMKLSVQQLVKAYNDKSEKFDNFFNKVTATILNQIETLRNIATEFSNFARMPKLKLENINCNEIIQQSINLFTDEKIIILFKSNSDEAIINGDAEQLKRTIINMIRNSIQAEATEIFLSINENDINIELSITDNGKGIPKENFTKIFEPNFTTKDDGMGLGLSMARRYLRSTEADIFVAESSQNKTVIKITFPKLS